MAELAVGDSWPGAGVDRWEQLASGWHVTVGAVCAGCGLSARRRRAPVCVCARAGGQGVRMQQPTLRADATLLRADARGACHHAPYALAWDNITGFRSYCVGVRDQSDAQRHAEGDVVPKDEDAPRGVRGRRRQRHARAPAGRACPSPGGLASALRASPARHRQSSRASACRACRAPARMGRGVMA